MLVMEPVNAANLTTDVVRMLNQQGILNQQQQGMNLDPMNQRRRNVNININAGVSVVGDLNVVGPNLAAVQRALQQRLQGQGQTPASSTPGSRQVSGALQGQGQNPPQSVPGSRQVSGALSGRNVQQGPGSNAASAGSSGQGLQGNPVSSNASGGLPGSGTGAYGGDNSDLYEAPPKPGRPT